MNGETRRIVLFDGQCGLCTASVRFIIRRDPLRHFEFASLQSEVGRKMATDYGVEFEGIETLVLLETGDGVSRVSLRSEAALRIARHLNGPWPVLGVFLRLPRAIRDPLYRLVSRYRYRLFGRLDRDWIPPAEVADRFL